MSLPPWREAKAGGEPVPRLGPRAYGLGMAAGLFLMRWPAFFSAGPLDPDESQFVAGALTLLRDPMPWRSLEGQTAGPLVYFALLPLALFGAVNFFGARLVGCLIVGGALWFGYRALRAVWGDTGARLGVLPAFCFFALSTHPQFVHYSSEHVSVLLLAIGLWGFLAAMARETPPRPTDPRWLAAGSALGAIPFAKLQAVPPAAFLLIAAAAWVATRRAATRRRRAIALLALAVAVWVVPLTFAVVLTLGGVWENFWISYLAQNIFYAEDGWRGLGFAAIGRFLALNSRIFGALFFGTLAAAAVLAARLRPGRAAARWPLFVLGGFLVASLPACLTVNRYVHYLLFLVMPAALLAGAFAAEALRQPAATVRGRLALFLGLAVLPVVVGRLFLGNPHLAALGAPRTGPIIPVTEIILRHAAPGDTLAVWGWWVEPHVTTRLRQATSDCNAWSQITPGPYRDYFRRRYLAEVQANRPPVFVDAAAPAEGVTMYFERKSFGHEIFPELRDYVADHYRLQATIDGVRIYVRRH